MTKIHIDTDLGGDIDDLCALAMVLHWPDVQITGITAPGDTNGKRTGYVRYALKVAGRDDIQVAAGADTSQGYFRYELGLPKEEKYWPVPVQPSPNEAELAIDLLKNSIEQGARIVGIGPYTNLYLLDRQYPGILKKAELTLMGGFIQTVRKGYPQWKNKYDFNIQVDIKSSKHVLQNSNPLLVQLSVTAETALRRSQLDRLRSSNSLCQLIARQAEAFAEDAHMDKKYGNCKNVPKDIINFQYDGVACAIALGWREGVQIKELPLVIEEKDGYIQERVDESGKLMKVVTEINGPRFNEFWLNQVTSF